MTPEERARLVSERDALEVPEALRGQFCRLADAGWGARWVSPIQETSHDPDGPVVMGTHWLDAEGAERRRADVDWYGGYLPDMDFNRVLDLALWYAGLTRWDVYVTQAAHYMPLAGPRAGVRKALWQPSFERVTRYEIGERPVLALGGVAQRVCRAYGVRHLPFPHPGTSGPTRQRQARAMAAGLE